MHLSNACTQLQRLSASGHGCPGPESGRVETNPFAVSAGSCLWATRIDEVQSYDADPDTVFAMLADEEFIVHKRRRAGRSTSRPRSRKSVTAPDPATSGSCPAKVPGFVKRFLGDTIPMDGTQTWAAADGQGARDAEFSVDFDGQPIRFSGTFRCDPRVPAQPLRPGTIRCTVLSVGDASRSSPPGMDQQITLNKEQRVVPSGLEDHA